MNTRLARVVATISTGTACCALSISADAREAGDVVAVSNIGVPVYTHNFDTGKDVGIGDRLLITEFFGGHYFVTSKIRVGLMVQWTEQYAGALPSGGDHFTTFALLPQVGWNFYDHFSAAAIFTYAPRAGGKARLDLGVQALVGWGLPITKTATLNLALEIPYNFRLARTIGITPLAGLTFAL
jgi:hypothetical protein